MQNSENPSWTQENTSHPESEQSKHILVVDDHPSIRLGMEAQLTTQGYHVTTAEDGQAALNLINEGSLFNLIITDLRMPIMSGFQLIKEVRQLDTPMNHVPIILQSTLTEDELEAYKSQLSDYDNISFIRKTDTSVNLIELTESLLNAQEG